MRDESPRLTSGPASEERRTKVAEELVNMSDSELLTRYKPELFGEGGEHAVFAMPLEEPERKVERIRNIAEAKNDEGRVSEVSTEKLFGETKRNRRNVIAKVERARLLAVIENNLRRGDRLDTLSFDEYMGLEAVIEQQQKSISAMKQYFGDGVLQERIYLMPIPVTDGLLNAIAPKRAQMALPTGTHEAWAIVHFQERAPDVAFAEGSFGLRTTYAELAKDIKVDDYFDENRVLLDGWEALHEREILDRVIVNHEAFEAADNDPELRMLLIEFIDTAIRYTNETGEILDFVGSDNIRVYQEEVTVKGREGVADEKRNVWKLKLIDARFGNMMFQSAQSTLRRLISRDPLAIDRRASSDLMNALAYTRFINAAALRLGMEKRLALSDESLATFSTHLLDLLHRGRFDSPPAQATMPDVSSIAEKTTDEV